MDLYAVTTKQSVYIIGHGEGLGWTVLSRTPSPNGVSWLDESRRYSGELMDEPQVGERMRFFDAGLGNYVNSTPVVRIVRLDTAAEATWGDAYRAFNDLANTVRDLGRKVGFEGISKTKGMDSVETILEDLGRAIRFAR